MVQIKLHIEKLSRGLKSKLAILAFTVVTIALSSAFTVGGLYLYGQAHPNNVKPVNISKTTTSPNKVSTSTATKNSTPQPAKTSTTTTTSAPKPVAVVEPVVVVQPVAPAPSSSVDSLTSAPSDSSSATTTVPPSDTSTNPVRVSSTTYTSTNWSGYLATGGNFSTVSGSWVVPAVTGEAGVDSYDGAWIGIGGVTAQDLVQVGTLDNVATDGTISSAIFYEILPAEAVIVDMPVKASDSISASITEMSLNQWLVVINNLTTGGNFTKSISYTSSHSSAEWIEEDPSYISGSLMPFANFGTIAFSSLRATVDSYLYNIADIGASPITMVARRLPIAVPSAILGTGFSVTRN